MCGLAGWVVRNSGQSAAAMHDLAKVMAGTMDHRGPDSQGVWVDETAGIALGHRRLSVIDLSSAGNQPMVSASGRFVIAYNGEVYNFADLAAELGRSSGHSDTEVVLEACEAWGVEAALKRMVGMFAFALWDRHKRTLTLARDRLGIKPLYWANTPNGLIFASELKALTRHPACPRDINHNAIASYLRHAFIPAPSTIYHNVHKLMPGQMLVLDDGQDPALSSFWDMRAVALAGPGENWSGESDAIRHLDGLLGKAVEQRMISDVPLGALLSGGIDSSLITALMQSKSAAPIRSFSIGFNEAQYDEARHAAGVAAHLGTDHTELFVTPDQARDVIPSLPDIYDEPFADSSQTPTYLVSALTREHVTVALSGDGGDEVFGGYTRYFTADRFGKTLYAQPKILRAAEAKIIQSLSPRAWDQIMAVIPKSRRLTLVGDKLHKLADVLQGSPDDFYRRLVSQWPHPNDIVRQGQEHQGLLWDEGIKTQFPNIVDRMQVMDTMTYLPDDILTKVDRASMAVSLEVRVPLLDHRVVEYAWTLPRNMKVRAGQGKWILRQLLDRYVPKQLIDRPKMGFGVPIDQWLRGPLRDWAIDTLSPVALDRHGLVHSDAVQKKLHEHLSGHRNWQYQLWAILMLQSWCDRWIGKTH